MYDEIRLAKKAKGDGPTISGARLAGDLLESMKDMDQEAKQAYLAENDKDVEQIKAMYCNNIGIAQ